MKNQKGITLIALVITIIVMLILVAVSISVALNGGLFQHAKNAKTQTETEMTKENKLDEGKANIGAESDKDIQDYATNILINAAQ